VNSSLSNRAWDRLQEQIERRYAEADRRRVPRPPDSAIPLDVYPDETIPVPEPLVIDTTQGTSGERDSWETWAIKHKIPLRVDDYDAVEQLDKLRAELMERDEIEPPKVSHMPTRRDPTAGFLHHHTVG
jgi:hypothetical protein